jgi:WD40 repeat protein/serine/threonine protein kinase
MFEHLKGLPDLPAEKDDAQANDAPLPIVPGYELLATLGSGGMGVVFKARQIGLKRTVALKMILGGAHASREQLIRFRSEAEAVARLQHPNIVQIFEVGEHHGQPFFSLEFMDGGTLKQHLAGTPQLSRWSAALIETLARAVHFAHQQGVVHRDLKPENVLLKNPDQGREGFHDQPTAAEHVAVCNLQTAIPKIADFGLAKRLDLLDDGRTQTGYLLGTPSYMAPEQADGRAKQIGLPADVYALGAMLYELVTGRPPFKGASMSETLEQVRGVEPVPPRRLQPRLPRDLETICLKCLHKEPERRYTSALALAEDLRRFLNREPIRARPVSTFQRAWRWATRRPATAGLLAVSLLAGLALIGLGVSNRFRARLQEQVDRAETYDYFYRIAHAHTAWRDGEIQLMAEKLDECPPSRRLWEWRYLRRLAENSVFVSSLYPAWANCVAYSPDGGRIACGFRDGMIRLWDATTGSLLHEWLSPGQSVSCVCFDPKGRLLASGHWSSSYVRLWDVATGKESGQPLPHSNYVEGVAFSPDGRYLASASMEPAVHLWDVASRQCAGTFPRLDGDQKGFIEVVFSPDGLRLFTTDKNQTIKVWNARTRVLEQIIYYPGTWLYGLAVSPNGRLVASGCDQDLRVWDWASGHERACLKGHSAYLHAVAFDGTGQRLASASADSTVKLWDLSLPQSDIRTFKGHRAEVRSVAFSPDGGRLVSASRDGTVRVWDPAADFQDAWVLRGQPGPCWSLAFHPKGVLLAATHNEPKAGQFTVALWDPDNRRRLRDIAGHTAAVRSVAFSPDGTWLASGSDDRTVRLQETATGMVKFILGGHAAPVIRLAFSRRGQKLASADANALIIVWDLADGHEVFRRQVHLQDPACMAFNSDDSLLASGAMDGSLSLWNAATGEQVHHWSGHGEGVQDLAFHPSGKELATCSNDQSIRFWNTATAEELRTWKGHGSNILTLAYNRDADRLASGDAGGVVKIWDVTTGSELLSLRGHERPVRSVAFSPDDSFLATAGDDGTVRLWDGRPLH